MDQSNSSLKALSKIVKDRIMTRRKAELSSDASDVNNFVLYQGDFDQKVLQWCD